MKGAEDIGPKGLKEFPCIAAFVVQGQGIVRKVNCGGGAYSDYLADPLPDDQQRYAPTGDFFRDWAEHQFGLAAAEPIAAILQRIDGHLPTPAPMCPGGIETDRRPWSEAEKSYSFVDELAACRPLVEGTGNLGRFDYWLDTYRYLKATGRVACRLGELDRAMERLKNESQSEDRPKLARELALPVRLALVQDWGEMVTLLLGTVGNWGEIGTVLTHEMFNMQYLQLLNRHDQALAALLGQPLPAEAAPWNDYRGPDRLIVPTVRANLLEGEDLKLKIMVLASSSRGGRTGAAGEFVAQARLEPIEKGCLLPDSALFWRPLGGGEFRRIPLQHVNRSVYSVVLPAQISQGDDFEYYLAARLPNGRTLHYPPTAPELNQTVVFAPPK